MVSLQSGQCGENAVIPVEMGLRYAHGSVLVRHMMEPIVKDPEKNSSTAMSYTALWMAYGWRGVSGEPAVKRVRRGHVHGHVNVMDRSMMEIRVTEKEVNQKAVQRLKYVQLMESGVPGQIGLSVHLPVEMVLAPTQGRVKDKQGLGKIAKEKPRKQRHVESLVQSLVTTRSGQNGHGVQSPVEGVAENDRGNVSYLTHSVYHVKEHPMKQRAATNTAAYASCNDLMEGGLKDSEFCEIDPLGFGTPVWVYCNLDDIPGEGITQIAHKEPLEINVDLSTGFRRDFEYNVTSLNIDNILDISRACRQFISWKCIHAPITSGDTGMITYAEDRQGTQVQFFPGSDSDHENSCACGVTGTCDDPATKCNCDANDDVQREDSGYYSTADGVGLPIMSMMSSSSDGGPAILYVGPLQCLGRANLTWGRR